MAFLQKLIRNVPVEVFPLRSDTTLIGRKELECDLVLPSPNVSREHARIDQRGGQYYLTDLKSRNGTVLNGKKISEPQLLEDGDLIEFSAVQFQFHSDCPSGIVQSSESEIPLGNRNDDDDGGGVQDDSFDEGSCYHEKTENGRHYPVRAGVQRQGNRQRVKAVITVAHDFSQLALSGDPGRKLLLVLQFLQAVRNEFHCDRILAISVEQLLKAFSAFDRIVIVETQANGHGYCVLAAHSRKEDEIPQLVRELIERSISNAEATLFVDQWRRSNTDETKLRNMSFHWLMTSPMVGNDGTVIGAIQLETSRPIRDVDQTDLARFVLLSQFVGSSLEQSRRIRSGQAANELERSTELLDPQLTSILHDEEANALKYSINQRTLPSTPPRTYGNSAIIELDRARTALLLFETANDVRDTSYFLDAIVTTIEREVRLTGSPTKAVQAAERALQDQGDRFPMSLTLVVAVVDKRHDCVRICRSLGCPVYCGSANEILLLPWKGAVVDERQTQEMVVHEQPASETSRMASVCGEQEVRMAPGETLILFAGGMGRLKSQDGRVVDEQILSGIVTAAAGYGETCDEQLLMLFDAFRGNTPLSDPFSFATVHRTASPVTATSFDQQELT